MLTSQYGLNEGNKVVRCGGEGVCDRFTECDAPTFEEKVLDACTGCMTCEGRAPFKKDEEMDEEGAMRMVSQIAHLAQEFRTGFLGPEDLTLLEEMLVSHWLRVEKDCSRFIQVKLSAFMDGFSQKK